MSLRFSKSLGRLYEPGGGEDVLLARLSLQPKPKDVARLEVVPGRP